MWLKKSETELNHARFSRTEGVFIVMSVSVLCLDIMKRNRDRCVGGVVSVIFTFFILITKKKKNAYSVPFYAKRLAWSLQFSITAYQKSRNLVSALNEKC